MRFVSTCKNLAKAYCVWATCSSSGWSQDFSSTLEQGPWISSLPFLKETPNPVASETVLPFVTLLKEALVKGLNNVEQQRTVLKIQSESGTRPKSFGEGYLGPQRNAPKYDANATHATRWTLFKNAKTYAGKEIHIDIVPESFKAGFRFDQSEAAVQPVAIANGTPVTYGLILTGIEPSAQALRVASIDQGEDDLLYFQNAPKARLHYEIGPIALNPVPEHPYAYAAAPEAKPEGAQWRTLIPDYRFRGKFSPRALPTAAKPMPDQMLSLEQVQGYYSSDILFVNGLHKESVIHRLRLPLYDRFNVYGEYNDKFKPIKLVIADYLYYGPFSTLLEHYNLEKRYRAGFFYRKNLTVVELFNNLPDNALNSKFSRKQQWELNVQTSI